MLRCSWDGRPFGHNRHKLKIGGCAIYGELGPHLTQCGLGRGLPSYQWHLNPSSRLATTDMDWKLGAVPHFFERGELSPHLTQCGQGRGLPPCQVSSWSIQPFGHNTPTLQTDRTDRQRSDSIGRTVLQTVAQKLANTGPNSTLCFNKLDPCYI